MVNKQEFLNAIYQDIEIVKGDTLAFNFQLQGLQGETPEIYFSCAEHYDETPLFTLDLIDGISLEDYNIATDTATYSVRVAPIKTKDLDLNRYYYDLEATISGDVLTLMRGRLTLLYGVTN